MDSSLQKTGEHSASQATAREDSGSLAEFIRLVPAPQDIVASNKSRGLEDSLEEANDHDLPWVVREPGAEGQQAPCNHAAREIDAGRELLQREIVGNLAQDIAAIEDCRKTKG